MTMAHRKFAVGISLAAIGLLSGALTGCTSSSAPSAQINSSSSSYASGQSIVVRSIGDFATFDPQNDQVAQGIMVWADTYDTLLAFNKSGALIPYLATSWKIDGRSIVFHLRTDATCDDGTKVTPTVVMNSFARYINPASPGATLGQVFPTGGPFTVSANNANDTFTFTSTTAQADNIYGFASPFTGIICPAGLADPALLKTQPEGSGPYTLVSAIHGDDAVLKLRPSWAWGPMGITAKTPGIPETVTIRQVENDTTAANLVLAGQLNVALIEGPDEKRLAADTSLHQYQANTYATDLMFFNRTAGHATSSNAVREAIMDAISASAWNTAVYDGLGRTSTSFMTSDARCYDPNTKNYYPTTSVSAAQKVLVDAGYTLKNGSMVKDGQTIPINLLTSEKYGAGSEYLYTQLKAVGLDVTLNALDNTTYADRILDGNFDVAVNSPGATTPIAGPAVIKFYIGSPVPKGLNLTQSQDSITSQLEQEADAAEAATTQQASCAAWAQVQDTMLQQHVLLPLAAPSFVAFTTNVDLSLFPAAGNAGTPGNPDYYYMRVLKG
jgi:peptide/nickel transport system substrate-binding protein